MSINYKAGIAYGYTITYEEFLKSSYLNQSRADWGEVCDDYIIITDCYGNNDNVIFGINIATCDEGASYRLHDIVPNKCDMINIVCLFKEYFPNLKNKTPGLHLYLEIS